MRIRRLKLTGFKSFVEPAELRIEPGLTGVVGPNGCGKSNLLEAIRWVMGEGSAKSLRGGGMDDVIFAGTATRPQRDFAEVSLLIEREAGESEVVRRIERGAGSAYRIDGRDVRAKDVALLFADAATGAHSPALVSQGRIGAVIAAKPGERRQMLEEAAGIAGLHVRRKDAEAKLRATEANLARLGEMIADMETRAAALRRQAKAAERYRALTDRIRLAEARLLFARWREAAAAADAARTDAEAAKAQVEKASAAQREAALAQAEAGSGQAAIRAEAQAARDRASAIAHRLATVRAERETLGRWLREIEGSRAAIDADRAREQALGRDAASAIDRLDAELAELALRGEGAEQRGRVLAEAVAEAADAARAIESALADARARQAAELAEVRVETAAREAACAGLARAEQMAQRLSAELAGIGADEQARADAQAAEAALAAGHAALDAAQIAGVRAEEERAAAAGERDIAESDAASARAALAALQSEAKALLRTVDSGGARDRAIDRIRAAPAYERALAAALGDDIDAALGEGPRRWAGSEHRADDPALPARCIALADHVDAPAALARRLAQIGVVDTDDGTIVLAVGQRIVTRDGRLRRWDGFVVEDGGAAAAERLIRLNRLTEIEGLLPEADRQAREAQQRVAAAMARLAEWRDAAEGARRAQSAASLTIAEASRKRDAAAAQIALHAARRAGAVERLAAAEGDLVAARSALALAEEGCAALPDTAKSEALVADLRDEAECAQRRLADARGEAAGHAHASERDRQRAEAAARERGNWRARAGDAANRSRKLAARLAAIEKEAGELADAPDRIAQALAELEGEEGLAREAQDALFAREREGEEAIRLAAVALADAGEQLAAARERRAGAAARAEAQDARRTELARISGDRFECPPVLLPGRIGFEEADLGLVSDLSTALERATAERERLGPVNLVAGRELEELTAQHDASKVEHDELIEALQRLRGSIGSLNREGRARLLAAFETVDRHFRSLFTTLFEGGQAHLALVESDDPLEAGLEIMVQPPGKRLSALTLLSGGEQALTAVALIFALFLTNPAPICVLDEVDAPLDDANIERFCDLLERMSGETDTRYLVVTHNAVTMSRMHRLFGVTMVERGISRLVSVDLGGAEQLLAAE